MYTDNEELFYENLVTHLDREGDGTKPTGTKSYVQKLILGAMPEELQPGMRSFYIRRNDDYRIF